MQPLHILLSLYRRTVFRNQVLMGSIQIFVKDFSAIRKHDVRCQTEFQIQSSRSKHLQCKHYRRIHENHHKDMKHQRHETLRDDSCSGVNDASDNQEKVDRGSSFHSENRNGHVPVMVNEVLSVVSALTCKEARDKEIIDMTFGAGGHTRALLDNIPDSHIYALDRDPLAYKIACDLAVERPSRVVPMLGRFSELPSLLAAQGVQPGSLDGVLMDLGSSSMQFDQSERGFSLSADGPLDMRMEAGRDPDQPTAADVVNSLDETDLANIFRKYGEDKRSKKIAHAIVEARSAFGRITTTRELAGIVESVCEGAYGLDRLGRYSHPATKIFQALRIFVNNELNELNCGLEVASHYLRPGGICVVISFHSLEDRIVKRHFHSIDLDEKNSLSIIQRSRLLDRGYTYSKKEMDSMLVRKWEPIDKKVMTATEQEVNTNPRSRSAKLRAAVKLDVS